MRGTNIDVPDGAMRIAAKSNEADRLILRLLRHFAAVIKHLIAATFLSLSLLTTATPVSSGTATGKELRFGIGLALLATEQCKGFQPGPMFHQLMSMVRKGARVSKAKLDEPALFERSKREVLAELDRVGKEVCASAEKVADPKGIIARK